jgi:hypothetical protein
MARRFLAIVALAIVATALSRGTAAAPSVAVIVVPRSSPVFRSPDAAHGLLVPGEGATVTRRAALASLVRGDLGNSIVRGGLPTGEPLIRLERRPARFTFYVALPPPGRHDNVVRYPIAVRGAGYHDLLTSSSTRLPGLVSIADVAPSARALARGGRPRIRSRDTREPLARLAELDRRLDDARAMRNPAAAVLAGFIGALAALALATRAAALGRAALLAVPTILLTALVLSGAGISSPWVAVPLLGIAGGTVALAAAWLLPPRLPLAAGLAACLGALFVLLWARPEWNALAAIGPHPESGGRFYGFTNQVETLLLAPALVLGALTGARVLPAVAMLTAAGVGAGRLGADGGGFLVFLAAFLVLGLRLHRVPAARAAAATAIAGAGAFALVAVDAATGGASHVSDALGGGPGGLLDDFTRRLHLSWAAIGATWNAAFFTAIGLAALVWFALRRPRLALLDAYLAGIAVSLLVNDTPNDVAGYGSLSAIVLWVYLRSEEGAGRLQ